MNVPWPAPIAAFSSSVSASSTAGLICRLIRNCISYSSWFTSPVRALRPVGRSRRRRLDIPCQNFLISFCLGRGSGAYLGHVGVDGLLAGRRGYRYPVVAVADEVQAADPVDLDRRNRRAAPLSQRQRLPAGPD